MAANAVIAMTGIVDLVTILIFSPSSNCFRPGCTVASTLAGGCFAQRLVLPDAGSQRVMGILDGRVADVNLNGADWENRSEIAVILDVKKAGG